MSHVCAIATPPNQAGQRERDADDDDASKFPLWAQPRVQRTCMFVDMLRTWHNNKMLLATADPPSPSIAFTPLAAFMRHQQWQLSWLDTSESLANRLALQARAQARATARVPACVSHFAWVPQWKVPFECATEVAARQFIHIRNSPHESFTPFMPP